MTKLKSTIPQFKSIQEEAEFGDTHDTTDYLDEMRSIKVKFVKPRGLNRLQLKKMYTVLDEMNGIGGKGIVDASTTIDEVLYGENGAWRGTMPPKKVSAKKTGADT